MGAALSVLPVFASADYFSRGQLFFPGLATFPGAGCFCGGSLCRQSVRILPSDVPLGGVTGGFCGATVPIHGFTEEKNPKEATQTNTQTACFLHAREYIAEILKNLYV